MIEFPRIVNEELFHFILGRWWSEYEEEGYENDTFQISPYDWNYDGDDSERAPNFWHKPSGFKLWWYKYPLRSAEANMEISSEQFWHILHDCMNSLHNGRYVTEIDEWWRNNDR